MCALILDIKIVIAGFDQDVWYALYRHDAAFREFARTKHGRRAFVDAFTVVSLENKVVFYRLLGKPHRENDLPAVIHHDGARFWMRGGVSHRDDDRPAVVFPNGERMWYHYGYCHRGDNKPAIIRHNGDIEWYRFGYPCHLHAEADLLC